SSARGSTSARKRWPSSSSSTPPAPRTASEMRKFVPARTVGWNWTNSISANTAPARAAARIPAPVHTPPLVERGKIPLYPPVATAALARLRPTLLCDLSREEAGQGHAGATTPGGDAPLRAMRRLRRERGRAAREQVGGEPGRDRPAPPHRASVAKNSTARASS